VSRPPRRPRARPWPLPSEPRPASPSPDPALSLSRARSRPGEPRPALPRRALPRPRPAPRRAPPRLRSGRALVRAPSRAPSRPRPRHRAPLPEPVPRQPRATRACTIRVPSAHVACSHAYGHNRTTLNLVLIYFNLFSRRVASRASSRDDSFNLYLSMCCVARFVAR
jgi:hypothetical protein